MSRAVKSRLVSELTSDMAMESSKKNENRGYSSKNLKEFAAEVNEALRGVSFHYHTPNEATVYRPDEIHALGEIGYKNTKAKGNGELNYYVAARGITNFKYRSSSWQHHIVSTKSMKSAVSAAATHLKSYTCEESAQDTLDIARKHINDAVNARHMSVRTSFTDFIGSPGYNNDFGSDIIEELRGHTFTSPSLNEASATFYGYLDAWREAKDATKNDMYYVGLIGDGAEQLLDSAHVTLGYPHNPHKIEPFSRCFAEQAPEWVKGRVAVLSMVEPLTYVQGVGLRMNDRIFYVLGDSN